MFLCFWSIMHDMSQEKIWEHNVLNSKFLVSYVFICSDWGNFDVILVKLFFFQLQYTFQNVFDEETSQKTLFECVGLPLMDDLLHGKNGK